MSMLETFIIVFTIILSTIIILWHIHYMHEHNHVSSAPLLNINYSKQKSAGSCSASCDSIDPVSDPRYNMQQIIKQSILLEEHLTNKNISLYLYNIFLLI